jgi:hypothetical protein
MKLAPRQRNALLWLAAAIVVLAIWLPFAKRAQAQVVVDAPALNIAALKSYLQDLKSYAQELQDYVQYVKTAESALQIAQGIAHNPTNIGGYMALAGVAGFDLNSYLPVSPYTVMGLTSGYSGADINGKLGKLTGLTSLFNSNFDINKVHQCTAKTFACQLMTEKAYQAAGQTAIAQQAYQTMQSHMTNLQMLQAKLGTTKDVKETADISAAIQVEQTFIQNQTALINATTAMANAQNLANSNRVSEFMKRDSDAYIASVQK